MAVAVSVLSIVVLAVLLHVILYFAFKIDARQLLVAATIASLVIVFLMMALYRFYNLSPTSILVMLVVLAVISALVITLGEQYFALFPQKRMVGEPTPLVAGPGTQAPLPETGSEPLPLGVVPPAVAMPSEPPVGVEPPAEGPVLPIVEPPVEVAAPLAGTLPGAGGVPAATAADTGVPTATAAPKDEEEIARLLDEGYDKLDKGDFKGALESFQLAIIFVDELDTLAKLRVEMGRLWFMQEQLSMARTELQEALRISQRAENTALEEEIRELLDNL